MEHRSSRLSVCKFHRCVLVLLALSVLVASAGNAIATAAPVDGICGSANNGNYSSAPITNLCTAGSVSDVTGIGPWTWSCAGLASSGTASCSAAQAGGVVYRSSDAGVNWIAGKAGLGFNSGIDSMVVSPAYTSDHTMFLGAMNGIYKSSDSGDTWSMVQPGHATRSLVVSPAFAGDRTIFAGMFSAGIYKSTDGGATWTTANRGLESLQVRSLAISPAYDGDRTIFTGMLGNGIYKSIDGAASWLATHAGLADQTVLSLAVSPNYALDRTVFAATTDGVWLHGGPCYRVYKSIDGGSTWILADAGLSGSLTDLAISPAYAHDQTLFAVTSRGIYKSDTAGNVWGRVNSSGDSIVLSPAYATDQTLFVGSDTGVCISNDGGSSWSTSKSDVADGKQLRTFAVSPDFGNDHAVFAIDNKVIEEPYAP